jgi:hypothetical protein
VTVIKTRRAFTFHYFFCFVSLLELTGSVMLLVVVMYMGHHVVN